MAKQTKKSAVKPEMRRQWLKRYEEDGESPPRIAKAAGYDVRTVRKQIDLERQERERREAKFAVLRGALEDHYADLCSFTQKVDSALGSDSAHLAELEEDPMWSALREHLPRFKMWKNLAKWESLHVQLEQMDSDMKQKLENLASTRSPLEFAAKSHEVGLSEGAILALAFHLKAVAKGEPGLDSRAVFLREAVDRETTWLRLGAFIIGRIPNTKIDEIQQFIVDLLNEIITWPERDDLGRLLGELKRLHKAIHEELLVIILRRVVPGKCKYCPI